MGPMKVYGSNQKFMGPIKILGRKFFEKLNIRSTNRNSDKKISDCSSHHTNRIFRRRGLFFSTATPRKSLRLRRVFKSDASKIFLTRPHEKSRELRHCRGQNATNRGAAPLLEFLRYVGSCWSILLIQDIRCSDQSQKLLKIGNT